MEYTRIPKPELDPAEEARIRYVFDRLGLRTERERRRFRNACRPAGEPPEPDPDTVRYIITTSNRTASPQEETQNAELERDPT